jgi:DNA-binding Lrp family transcriptional regulator
MPIRAYVFVSTDPGKAKGVAGEISKIGGNSPRVLKVSAITGRFDVLVEVEDSDVASLANIVLTKISQIPNVRRTETAFAV